MYRCSAIATCFVVLLLSFAPAHAEGIADSFFVVHVRADKTGKGFVYFDRDLEGTTPDCSTLERHPRHKTMLAFDLESEAGRAIFSLVLAAQMSGKRIWAKGTGDCTIDRTVEDWAWGHTVN